MNVYEICYYERVPRELDRIADALEELNELLKKRNKLLEKQLASESNKSDN